MYKVGKLRNRVNCEPQKGLPCVLRIIPHYSSRGEKELRTGLFTRVVYKISYHLHLFSSKILHNWIEYIPIMQCRNIPFKMLTRHFARGIFQNLILLFLLIGRWSIFTLLDEKGEGNRIATSHCPSPICRLDLKRKCQHWVDGKAQEVSHPSQNWPAVVHSKRLPKSMNWNMILFLSARHGVLPKLLSGTKIF